jgi:capsular polysaccharide biosynthesis protein
MNLKDILKLIRKKGLTMILAGAFFSAAAFLFLVLTQKNFKASSDILVVQNQAGFSDYYALSRSADYLSNVLLESIYSQKFIGEVMATGKVNSAFLPSDNVAQLKAWQNTVKVTKNSNAGIISIAVYGNSSKDTEDAANAVLDVLVNKHSLFLGDGQNIDVRILSGPIVEKNPTLLQIFLSAAGGFIFGIILVFIFAYYKEESEKDKKSLPKENREIIFTDQIQEKNDINPDDPYFSANSDYWKKRLEENM